MIINIKEDEHSRTFSGVKKLVTNTSDGGTATWIPEDEAVDYVEKESLSITENGTYKAKQGAIFGDINVNVAQSSGDETDGVQLISDKTINANGTYKASDEVGGDDKQAGYESVTVDLPLESKTITKNGVYNAADDVDSMGRQIQGYSSLDIQVGEGDEIKQVSKDIKKNGMYLPEDEGDDVAGFNQVNVALPFIEKKVIDHGGIYRASAEQDANGDEIQGYKSIEVKIKVTQPVMDCTMNVDHHESIKTLPFDISIGNTAPADYEEQDIANPPVVDFSHATIKMYQSGISVPATQLQQYSPFTQGNLNMGAGAIWKKWPDKVDDKEIKNWNDSRAFIAGDMGFKAGSAGTITEATVRAGGLGRYAGSGKNRTEIWGDIYTSNDRFRVNQENNVTKFIFSNSFIYSDNAFVIASNGNCIGWLVENVSFKKGDRFSFTVSVKCPSA